MVAVILWRPLSASMDLPSTVGGSPLLCGLGPSRAPAFIPLPDSKQTPGQPAPGDWQSGPLAGHQGKIGRVGESSGGAWEASLDLGSSPSPLICPMEGGTVSSGQAIPCLSNISGGSVCSSPFTWFLRDPCAPKPREPTSPPSSLTGFSGDIKVVCSSWMNLTWYPRESLFLSPG